MAMFILVFSLHKAICGLEMKVIYAIHHEMKAPATSQPIGTLPQLASVFRRIQKSDDLISSQ
jgi:hypothetical protein